MLFFYRVRRSSEETQLDKILNYRLYLATAHCADMYPDSDSDPDELREARQKISDTIGQWLQQQ